MKRTSNPLMTAPGGVPLSVVPGGGDSGGRAVPDAAAEIEAAMLTGCGA